MPLAPEIIASIVGGAASLAGAGVNAASGVMGNRNQYKWSQKMFNYQNWYNQSFYSPAMQMARLRQAGINPHEVSGMQGNSVSGSMTGDYQNPIAGLGDSMQGALRFAMDMYSQKKQLDNQTKSTDASVTAAQAKAAKDVADTARIKYYNSSIQPWEAVSAKHKSNILSHQVGQAALGVEKMANEIQLLSLQKTKYQLGIDLMNIQKQYADDYYKYQAQSVKNDAIRKGYDASIRGLELNDYQKFGVRPNDPYYVRMATNIVDNTLDGLDNGSNFVDALLDGIFPGRKRRRQKRASKGKPKLGSSGKSSW